MQENNEQQGSGPSFTFTPEEKAAALKSVEVNVDWKQQQRDQIAHAFAYHAPRTPDVAKLHEEIRALLGSAAQWIVDRVPAGGEQAQAIRKLEEAMFWANAGVARQRPA